MSRREAGYSLVELVLVIVILATIGMLAGPRFFNNDAFDERGYYDELASALRYAQKVAVASGCRPRASGPGTDSSSLEAGRADTPLASQFRRRPDRGSQ